MREVEQAGGFGLPSDSEVYGFLRVRWTDILAVLVVVGTLAFLLLPNYRRTRAVGSPSACKSNLKNIGTALEMYSTDWKGRYPASLSTLTPNYLKTMPECPSALSDTYSEGYRTSAAYNTGGFTDYYFVQCTGHYHVGVGIRPNYPQYDGIQGLIERGSWPAPPERPYSWLPTPLKKWWKSPPT